MITSQLLHPASIVVVGASNNVHKPGGAILKNLLSGGYTGELRAVNPKETEVQGVAAFADVKDIPDTDLAILAIPAALCPDAVEMLAAEKQVKAFIILSAGFGEETHEGAVLEDRILETVNRYGASLIGPNCIGFMNSWHHSVFSQPIPQLHPQGVDLISSSGATAVFILESAVTKGLQFNSVWSVGNAKQIGVEDVLQYMDEHFNPEADSRIKLLYIESIGDPDRLLFHASSLIKKGCKIAAIKAGSSESGSRAASSHTGAIASSDSAVEALFRKAGIVRCYSREEYIQMHYFDKILRRANVRLLQMTSGQYELCREALDNDEVKTGNSKTGLDLVVHDHYSGRRRSVKTLSGGESFMASLALALGLADEVQSSAGGIQLDAMFVDEGFGSLDDSALQQAVATLQGLSEGRRLVGIISHVHDLMDMIDTQLVVTKRTNGAGTGSEVQILA